MSKTYTQHHEVNMASEILGHLYKLGYSAVSLWICKAMQKAPIANISTIDANTQWQIMSGHIYLNGQQVVACTHTEYLNCISFRGYLPAVQNAQWATIISSSQLQGGVVILVIVQLAFSMHVLPVLPLYL